MAYHSNEPHCSSIPGEYDEEREVAVLRIVSEAAKDILCAKAMKRSSGVQSSSGIALNFVPSSHSAAQISLASNATHATKLFEQSALVSRSSPLYKINVTAQGLF